MLPLLERKKLLVVCNRIFPPPLWLPPSDLWAHRREVTSFNPPLSLLFGFLLDFSISYFNICTYCFVTGRWHLCDLWASRCEVTPRPTPRPSKVARPQTVKVTFQSNLYHAATLTVCQPYSSTGRAKNLADPLLWKPQHCNMHSFEFCLFELKSISK